MTATLLEQFIKEECTPHVRQLLAAALAEVEPSNTRFEFNRFEVTIDRNERVVVLEDVLDATEAGSHEIPLAAFAAALEVKL